MGRSIAIILTVIFSAGMFFWLRDKFEFSRYSMLMIMLIIITPIVLIIVIVTKIALSGKNAVVTTASAKFIYRHTNSFYVMLEWETSKGMVTANAGLQASNGDLIRRIVKSFPTPLPNEPSFSLSPKTYMNTKEYKDWEIDLPADFKYPQISIRYNEKAPTLFFEIIDILDY
jgi:hypothetical protein